MLARQGTTRSLGSTTRNSAALPVSSITGRTMDASRPGQCSTSRSTATKQQRTGLTAGRQRCLATHAQVVDIQTAKQVRIATASSCELGVSIYPKFSYNAGGGGGPGTVEDLGGGKLKLTFSASDLIIPSLTWRTASVVGLLPIPPPLKIDIRPSTFEGTLDTVTGECNMQFTAQFFFSVGPLYKAPPLIVDAVLTTQSCQGQHRGATGSRMQDGKLRLVGAATVPKCNDAFMDTFLMLPNDALAIMDATLEFA